MSLIPNLGPIYLLLVTINTAVLWMGVDNCIDEIEQWMAANRSKLNAHKTELLWTGTWSQLKKLTPMHPSLAFSSHQT